MIFVAGSLLLAGFVVDSASASTIFNGMGISSVLNDNPLCTDWLNDPGDDTFFKFGYRSNAGCVNYEGYINWKGQRLPGFGTSGNSKYDGLYQRFL